MKALLYRPFTEGGEPIPYRGRLELISHAGAGLPEARYSNSVQALDAAVARGFDQIELDFEETSDGEIVASHDWHQIYLELHDGRSIIPPSLATLIKPTPPTRAGFMADPIRGKLDPVDIPVLKAWLAVNPSVRIVTDVKSDNLAILRGLLSHGISKQQLIPQIYHRSELPAVRRLGFEKVIYTLYRDTSVPLADVVTFAKNHDVSVTMHAGRASRKTLRDFKTAGVAIYIHTINDPLQAEMLREWGATGVYTDFLWHPNRAPPKLDRRRSPPPPG